MPESLKKLIQIINFLPGIGEKSATKLAFFLLNANQNFLENFAHTLLSLKQSVHKCRECGALIDTNKELCHICQSSHREDNQICVVEEYLDMLTIENAGIFQGKYHIL